MTMFCFVFFLLANWFKCEQNSVKLGVFNKKPVKVSNRPLALLDSINL